MCAALTALAGPRRTKVGSLATNVCDLRLTRDKSGAGGLGLTFRIPWPITRARTEPLRVASSPVAGDVLPRPGVDSVPFDDSMHAYAPKNDERPRTRGTFILTGLEHRGVRPAKVRLAFYVAGESGLLAVWGAPRVAMEHIITLEQAIERSGFPVGIHCDWIRPDEYEARTFRHRYWVMETDYLEVLKRERFPVSLSERSQMHGSR